MKKKYIILFSLIILSVLVIALYFVDIPSPSKLINEEFKIIIE